MRKRAPYSFEYARIAVPDVAASRDFYEFNVGLQSIDVDDTPERVTLRCGLKHHCIELLKDASLERAKVLALGYSVESAEVLEDLRRRVVDAGHKPLELDERMKNLCVNGFGVRDPNGLVIELVDEFYEWAEEPNVPWRPEMLVHPFVWSDKFEETRALYMDVLGWQASDYIEKGTVFLRSENRYHHSMGLGKTPTFKVAHLCFKMQSFDHVMRARARAVYKGVQISPDLTNHSASRSLAFYMEAPRHGPDIELCDGHTVLTPEQHESHRARRLFRDPRNVDVWRVAGDDLVRGSTSSIKR